MKSPSVKAYMVDSSAREPYSLYSTLSTLVDRLDSEAMHHAGVIDWSCPVPSFGDPSHSRVATLGINPSNREFVDEDGQELEGADRRFHTLSSLRLRSWSCANSEHLRMILDTCRSYFDGNPYAGWFGKLELILAGLQVSYYDSPSTACHFDLVPYATMKKWSELPGDQHATLMSIAQDTLGLILRDTPVSVLILNGNSVVKRFELLSETHLASEVIPEWSLSRKTIRDVPGIAYSGTIEALSGIKLGREVSVLGFNHNLQGSFGVSSEVMRSIRDWIAKNVEYVQ